MEQLNPPSHWKNIYFILNDNRPYVKYKPNIYSKIY